MTTLLTEDEFNQLIAEYKNGTQISHEEKERLRDYYLVDPSADPRVKEAISIVRSIEARVRRMKKENDESRARKKGVAQ